MIKMFCAVPRRPDISEQQFHDHWRHPHGSMALEIDAARHYTQTHRVACKALPASQGRYDGIVEVWFDSVEAAASLPENQDYQRYLAPDEPNFITVPDMRYVFTDEECIDTSFVSDAGGEQDRLWRWNDRPNCIKLIQLVEADGDASWAQDDDASLGRRIGALRHVRCRPCPSIHADGAPFIGVRELWWPTLSAFEAGVRADRAALKTLVDRPVGSVSLLGTAERLR